MNFSASKACPSPNNMFHRTDSSEIQLTYTVSEVLERFTSSIIDHPFVPAMVISKPKEQQQNLIKV